MKVAIYIGKFNPFHGAHYKNIQYCNKHYDKTIVLAGSTNKYSSFQKPFDFQTIKSWIQEDFKDVIVKPVKDFIYNEDKWISHVEETVYSEFMGNDAEFYIVGYEKDDTSYYLKSFVNFKVDLIDNSTYPENLKNISSTDIRTWLYINPKNFMKDIKRVLPSIIEASIVDSQIFDNPNRNIGIPKITNVFFIEIKPDILKNGFHKLPKVKGSDDAADAMWVPISQLKNKVLFDDHSDIIEYFLKV